MLQGAASPSLSGGTRLSCHVGSSRRKLRGTRARARCSERVVMRISGTRFITTPMGLPRGGPIALPLTGIPSPPSEAR